MRRLKFVLDRKSLEIIYISFIRPILEYSDVVWDNCNSAEKEELEKIQHEAARIVTGCTKLVSINNLYEEVGWETLGQRRRKHKLILMYKTVKGLTPSYLQNLVPTTVGNLSQYHGLRNSCNLQVIPARTSLYANSFFPSTVSEWNNLSPEVRNAGSLNTFKYLLNRDRLKLSPLFYTGE